jgi:TolB-like protein/Flp pilus assembly protein TadD/transcriptional regulator with XRE-family HTH domain
MSNIADRLKKIVGDNVAQFARELGIHRQTLDNYLKGRIPKADFLNRLAKAKNININWLLMGVGETYLKTWSDKTIEVLHEKESKKRRQIENNLSKPKEKMKLTSPKKFLKIRGKLLIAIISVCLIVIAIIIWHNFIIKKYSAISILKENKTSIAVIPFKDFSPQKDQEYFCNGITETIISKLVRIQSLEVISLTSVIPYKETTNNIKNIGKEIGVEAILTGSIQKENNNIRIIVNLVNTKDASQIWSKTYDNKLKEIFVIQDEIAHEIVSKLHIELKKEQRDLLINNYPHNVEAYNLYLKGRYFWNKRTEAGINKSIEYFRMGLEKEPNFALAYAGMADSYNLLADYAFQSPEEVFPKAKSAAMKALKIDYNMAEAHVSLAFVYKNYDWNFPEAEREFKRAIELNPNYSVVHHWYAWFLIQMGRTKEAIREIEYAQMLDPLSLNIAADAAIILYYSRKYDQAIEKLQEVLLLDPHFYLAPWYLGIIYTRTGKGDKAIAEIQKARQMAGKSDLFLKPALAIGYAFAGKRAQAENLLNELLESPEDKYIPPVSIALIYAGLDNKELAFQWLEKAYRERDIRLLSLKISPSFDSLRSDPRFASLLKKINLQ